MTRFSVEVSVYSSLFCASAASVLVAGALCFAALGEVAQAQGVLAGAAADPRPAQLESTDPVSTEPASPDPALTASEFAEPETAGLRPRTVAIFPFANISGQPEDEWIGTGIVETVTADLGQFDGLSVVGREAFLPVLNTGQEGDGLAAGDDARSRDLARALGVSWIVTGGFQRVGDQLRITARIINVETGAAQESVKVDGTLDDIFSLQDQIVADLSGGLAGIAGSAAPPVTRQRRPLATGQTGFGGGEATTVPPESSGASPPAEPAAFRGRFDPTGSGSGSGEGNARGNRAAPAAAISGGITFDERPPGFASAPVVGDAGALAGRVTVRPVRTQTPPNVDGRLDDAVWQDAIRITDFVQQQPVDGAPATEETDVFLAYDNSNLYLAFHVKYQDPGIMRANRVDRDQAGRGDDTISVYFDTFVDQQRAYVFSVNGYGVQGDSIIGGTGGGGFGGFGGGGRGRGGGGRRGGVPRGDRSWDALYSSGGQPVEDGFTAEMAIPFKSLRYPARGRDVPHTWGFQIVREIRGKDETVVWSPVSRDVAGFLPQMGVLDGMNGLSTSRNLEIQPTFTGVRFGSFDEDLDKVVDGDAKPEGGVNLKYGVTSNLTADFTINPDFSQIESDRPQVEVNQRFALFFPELRPFFLEGAEIFQIQAPVTVVHTRTIVDPLYGGKLTGKAGKTTIGVLYANDEGASLGIDDPLAPGFDQSAQTFVGRVRYDLYPESFIGAVFTDREYLDGFSRLAGIDSNFRVGNTHSAGFRALRTDHVDGDGLQTDGYVLDAGFRKRGRNLSYSLDASALSPDFKTDVGFVRRTDQRLVDTSLGYQWWPQTWLISWGPEVRYGRSYDFDDILEDENFRTSVSANFAKNIRYNFNVSRDLERFGGIDFDKRSYGMFGNVNTSQIISFGLGLNWGDGVYFDDVNPFLGRQSSLFTFINFRPVSRFSSNININNSRFTDPNGFFIPGLNDGERDENGLIFNVNIFRALSTYQFTDRLLFRNITEFNTFDETIGLNFLVTYRVNSGTAFYIGYDDHYRQMEQFDDQVNITDQGYRQTNRAIFTKIQYLFRY